MEVHLEAWVCCICLIDNLSIPSLLTWHLESKIQPSTCYSSGNNFNSYTNNCYSSRNNVNPYTNKIWVSELSPVKTNQVYISDHLFWPTIFDKRSHYNIVEMCSLTTFQTVDAIIDILPIEFIGSPNPPSTMESKIWYSHQIFLINFIELLTTQLILTQCFLPILSPWFVALIYLAKLIITSG